MVLRLSTREAFLQSFIHQRYALLGRELNPFCLRHWLLLVALESPLLLGGDIGITDLQLAVMVCSTKSNREFFDASRFKAGYWWIWRRFTRGLSADKALHHFNLYIEDYLPSFPFWQNEVIGQPEKTPGFFVSAARLLKACPPDDVLNMALGEMLAWGLALNEAEGLPNENLMSDYESKILRSDPAFQGGS